MNTTYTPYVTRDFVQNGAFFPGQSWLMIRSDVEIAFRAHIQQFDNHRNSILATL